MGIADFGAGMSAELERQLTQRVAEQQRQFQNERQLKGDARAERAQQLLEQQHQAVQAETAQRNRLASEDRRIVAARYRADTIPGGTFAPEDDPGVKMDQAAGYGPLWSVQEGRPTVDVGPLVPGDTGAAKPRGFLRTLSTAQHNAAALQRDKEADNARQAAATAETTRHNRALEERPPREPTPHYSFMQTYDAEGKPAGVVRGNTLTGEAGEINLPGGGFLRTPGGRAELPPRVKSYLMQLRGKHQDFNEAYQELQGTLANAPGETFDRLATANALRQLYASPSGEGSEKDKFFRDLRGGGGGAPSILGGHSPASGSPPPRNPPAGGPYQPGQRIKLRDGSTATVIGVNPDGSVRVE